VLAERLPRWRQTTWQDGTIPAGAPRSWPALSALPLAPGKALRALAVTAWCWKPNTMSFKALLDHYGRDSAPVEVRRRDWLGIVPTPCHAPGALRMAWPVHACDQANGDRNEAHRGRRSLDASPGRWSRRRSHTRGKTGLRRTPQKSRNQRPTKRSVIGS
jgi:hypothetical protein